MELKSGMPIWAKRDFERTRHYTNNLFIVKGIKAKIHLIDKGVIYVTVHAEIFIYTPEEFSDYFTTTPPKEETEVLPEIERNMSDCPNIISSLIRSLNRILNGGLPIHADKERLDKAKQYLSEISDINFKDFPQKTENTEPPVFKSLEEIKDEYFSGFSASRMEGMKDEEYYQHLDKIAEHYAAQYREAYEAEKAENQRLKNRVSELESEKQGAIKLIDENIADMGTKEAHERFGGTESTAIIVAIQNIRLKLIK